MYFLKFRSVLKTVIFWSVLVSPLIVFSQDIIEKKNGEQIQVRIVSIEKNTVVYKRLDDPEFNGHTLSRKEVKSVRFENGKLVLFDDNAPKSYIAFSIGPSFSAGDLRKKKLDDAKYSPGYMNNGMFARLDAGVYLGRNWGIAIQAGGMNFNIDKEAYLSDLTNGSDALPAEVHYYASDDSTKESDRAFFNTISAGFLYSFRKNRHTFDVRLMAGVMRMGKQTLWEQKIFYPEDPSLSTRVNRIYKTSASGVGMLGIAYRYDLNDHWALRANADFYSGALKRKYSIRTEGAGASLFREGENTDYLRFQAVNIGIGVVYQFKRKYS